MDPTEQAVFCPTKYLHQTSSLFSLFCSVTYLNVVLGRGILKQQPEALTDNAKKHGWVPPHQVVSRSNRSNQIPQTLVSSPRTRIRLPLSVSASIGLVAEVERNWPLSVSYTHLTLPTILLV